MQRRIFLSGAMIVFAFWVGLAAAPRALAQDPNRLSQLKISVWPEYDQPTVLVMFDGVLADATNLPRDVSVLIPSRASLLVATFENADGSLAPEQAAKSTALGDGYTRVTYTLPTPKFHIEYYDDLLRGAPDKSMDFVFKAPSPVDQATLEVQQPLKAANLSVTPPSQTTRAGGDGFNYYVLPASALVAGQTMTVQVRYTKTDPNPSILPATAAPATAPVTPPASSPWSNAFFLVALVVLGLVAVIGFFLLWQRSRESARPAPRSQPRRSAERAGAASQVAAFCTQCGHGLAEEDFFCPRCGTKRRVV